MAEKEKGKMTLSERRIEHFKNVCPHGVPHDFYCKTCEKTISIPDDAVVKPEGYVKKKKDK